MTPSEINSRDVFSLNELAEMYGMTAMNMGLIVSYYDIKYTKKGKFKWVHATELGVIDRIRELQSAPKSEMIKRIIKLTYR